MVFHSVNLPHVPAVPYWCTILVLLICSLLSCSQAKSACKCPSSNQHPNNVYTLNNTFDNLHGYLLPANSSSTFLSAGLGSYKKLPTSKHNLSEPALLILDDQSIMLWAAEPSGNQSITLWAAEPSGDRTIREASFSVVFTMSIYQPNNQKTPGGGDNLMIFAIIPFDFLYAYRYSNESFAIATQLHSSWDRSEPIVGPTKLAGNQFTIMAGRYDQMIFNETETVACVGIDIEPLGPVDSIKTKYSVSIDYNSLGQNMTVQVSVVDGKDEGKQSSGNRQRISFSNISSQFGFFSFYSSMGQLFQLDTLDSTVERLSDDLEIIPHKKNTTIILSSVLGSAAATVVTAAVAYCYFNSKYRGWKKELDQLAKSMQLLPGVPIQFNFNDIRRATNNFHETTKLGRGGFGAVYRCRLPGPKKGEALEVAVKKFTRDDNRRYEDFLAEVSVINRLRHKNIVPLVGNSANPVLCLFM